MNVIAIISIYIIIVLSPNIIFIKLYYHIVDVKLPSVDTSLALSSQIWAPYSVQPNYPRRGCLDPSNSECTLLCNMPLTRKKGVFVLGCWHDHYSSEPWLFIWNLLGRLVGWYWPLCEGGYNSLAEKWGMTSVTWGCVANSAAACSNPEGAIGAG